MCFQQQFWRIPSSWQLCPPTKIAYDINIYDAQVYGICTVAFFDIYV